MGAIVDAVAFMRLRSQRTPLGAARLAELIEGSTSAATMQVNTEHTDNGRFPVRQHGPRRLWDEVEAAHTWWIEHGRPIRTRYGLTITRDSQTAWLDHPSNTVAVIVAGTWSKNVPH